MLFLLIAAVSLILPMKSSPEEEEALILHAEEEKLARDVYTTLYGQYSLRVFDNISKSEQRHMDRVLCFLEYYNIEDPASEEIGVFTNPDLTRTI